MKKIILLFLLALPAFSQTDQIDSLKKELVRANSQSNGIANDTIHSNLIRSVMKAYGKKERI